MKYVQRANEVLRVKDDEVEKYIKSGYDLLDDKGEKVVRKGVKDAYTRAEYEEVVRENERLRNELAKLKAKKDA